MGIEDRWDKDAWYRNDVTEKAFPTMTCEIGTSLLLEKEGGQMCF